MTRRAHGSWVRLVVLALPLVLVGLLPAPAEAAESADIDLRLADVTGVLGPEPEEAAGAASDGEASDGGTSNDAAATGAEPPGEAADELPPVEQDLTLRLLVNNRGEQAVEGMRVVVEIHPAADSRSELGAAFDGEGLSARPGRVHDQPVRELDALGAGGVAGVEEVITPEEAGWPDEGGVHPVRVSLVRGAEVLDELVTAVVWLGDDWEPTPLLTTMVWPVTDAPWRTDGGRYPRGAQRSIRPGERVDVLLRALEEHPDSDVLLAPAAHLVEDLLDQSSGFDEVELHEDGSRETNRVEPEDEAARRANETLLRLRRVAEELPQHPLPGPYADADIEALADHGQTLRELAGDITTQGRLRLQQGLGRAVDASAFVLDAPVGPEALDLMPTEHLLLPGRLAAGNPSTDQLRQIRSPSGRRLTVTVGDPVIEGLLADPELEGLAAAQRILAETAMLYFEAPAREGRILSLHPPQDWQPDPEMAHALLSRLEDAHWLELVSPSVQALRGRRAAADLQLVPPDGERLPDPVAAQLETALEDLAGVSDAQPEEVEEPPDDEEAPRSYGELRDALLRSTSMWLSGGPERENLIRDVQHAVDRAYGDIEVASGSQVTLTSDTGQIPVTVRRVRGGPITVRVRVTSQGQLLWEDRESDDLVLTDDEAHTVAFETRALGTGTFPVTVVVTDPSGTRELERTTLSVRSTAVSGPALSATGALVLALLLLGALRRRPRNPRLSVVDGQTDG